MAICAEDERIYLTLRGAGKIMRKCEYNLLNSNNLIILCVGGIKAESLKMTLYPFLI